MRCCGSQQLLLLLSAALLLAAVCWAAPTPQLPGGGPALADASEINGRIARQPTRAAGWRRALLQAGSIAKRPPLPNFEIGVPAPPKRVFREWQQAMVRERQHEFSSLTFVTHDHPPPGYVALCVIARDAHADLLEWVNHHARLGVSKIYLWDHASDPPMESVVKDFIAAGVVAYRHFTKVEHPSGKPQLYAYDQCLQQYGTRHTWMGFIDVDEFLMFRDPWPTIQSLPRFLLEFAGPHPPPNAVSGVGVHWLIFGSSGHVSRPAGGVLRSYYRCIQLRHAQHALVKTIVRTACTVSAEGPHNFKHNCSLPVMQTDRTPMQGARSEEPVHKRLALHHYATKSRDEFALKMVRGSAMKRQRGWEYFAFIDEWSTEFNFDGLMLWDTVTSFQHYPAVTREHLKRYTSEQHEDFWLKGVDDPRYQQQLREEAAAAAAKQQADARAGAGTGAGQATTTMAGVAQHQAAGQQGAGEADAAAVQAAAGAAQHTAEAAGAQQAAEAAQQQAAAAAAAQQAAEAAQQQAAVAAAAQQAAEAAAQQQAATALAAATQQQAATQQAAGAGAAAVQAVEAQQQAAAAAAAQQQVAAGAAVQQQGAAAAAGAQQQAAVADVVAMQAAATEQQAARADAAAVHAEDAQAAAAQEQQAAAQQQAVQADAATAQAAATQAAAAQQAAALAAQQAAAAAQQQATLAAGVQAAISEQQQAAGANAAGAAQLGVDAASKAAAQQQAAAAATGTAAGQATTVAQQTAGADAGTQQEANTIAAAAQHQAAEEAAEAAERQAAAAAAQQAAAAAAELRQQQQQQQVAAMAAVQR